MEHSVGRLALINDPIFAIIELFGNNQGKIPITKSSILRGGTREKSAVFSALFYFIPTTKFLVSNKNQGRFQLILDQ